MKRVLEVTVLQHFDKHDVNAVVGYLNSIFLEDKTAEAIHLARDWMKRAADLAVDAQRGTRLAGAIEQEIRAGNISPDVAERLRKHLAP